MRAYIRNILSVWLGVRLGVRGQAAVETAIIMPLMVFMLLGIIQLTLIQQARLMTEHAAFNAARAGIVWNASNNQMVNAAALSVIPALPVIKKNDPWGSLVAFAKLALIVKGTQAIDKTVASLAELVKMLGLNIGGLPAISLVQVEVVYPQASNWNDIPDIAKTDKDKKELDFDFIPADPTSSEGKKIIAANRLTIRTRFLYPMRIPFANYLMHTAWMAQAAGPMILARITGPIYQPLIKGQKWTEDSRVHQTIDGALPNADPLQQLFGNRDANLLRLLFTLHDKGLYLIPLRATYTMRMQSNIFQDNLSEGW